MRQRGKWMAALLFAIAAGSWVSSVSAFAPVEFGHIGLAVSSGARLSNGFESPLQSLPDFFAKNVSSPVRTLLIGGGSEGDSSRPQPGAVAFPVAIQTASAAPAEIAPAAEGGVRERLQAAADQVESKLIRLLARAPLLLVSVAIVLLFGWLGRLLSRRIHLSRFSENNPYFDALVARTVRWLSLLFGVLIALDLLDARSVVGAVLGSAGVAGIALGFAFRDIAENYVAGVLLSLRRPFAPGDHILVEKYEGKVVALTSRSTLLLTLDGVQMALPNALVFKSVVMNYSQNAHRRFEFTVVIDSAESIRESQQLALAHIAQVAGVLADPAPSWSADGHMAGGIQLRFLAWVDQRQSDLRKVRSEALRAVKAAFEKAAINSPHPVQYVFTAPLPADVARRLGVPTANESGAGGDTSVDRDMDQQLDEQRIAHDDENLI